MHGFLDLYEAGEREEANRYYEERLPDYSRAIPFEQFSEILENPKSLEFYRKMTHAPDSYDEFLLMGINNDRNDVISRIAKERLVEKEIETVPDLSPEDIVYFSKAIIARELMEDMETRLLLEKRAIHNWREELLTERIATELLREGVEVLHPALGGLKEVLEVEAEGD